MTDPLATLARRQALLDYADDCETRARDLTGQAAAELYEEALMARLTALARMIDPPETDDR